MQVAMVFLPTDDIWVLIKANGNAFDAAASADMQELSIVSPSADFGLDKGSHLPAMVMESGTSSPKVIWRELICDSVKHF